MDYIDKYNEFVEENPAYLKRIVENRWGYMGRQPQKWLDNEVVRIRGWLLANPKKGNAYKDWGRFIGNWLNRNYDWQQPQEPKTYMSNTEEQKHYQDKGKKK